MTDKNPRTILLLFASLCTIANAQDPIGTLEGQILQAGSPRLLQLAIKLIF